MFAVEQDVKAGQFRYGWERYENDGIQTVTVREPSDYNNAGTYSGTPDAGSYTADFKSFDIQTSANTLHWNRMSDGALVLCKNLGLYFRHDFNTVQNGAGSSPSYTNSIGTNFNTWGQTLCTNGATGRYGPLYSTRYDVTLLGGRYDVRVLRIGCNQVEHDQSAHKKYVEAAPDANWGNSSVPYGDGYWWNGMWPNTYMGYVTNGKLTYKNVDEYRTSRSYRLVAMPTGSVPTLSPMETDLGIITDPTSVTIQMAGTPTVSAKLDGGQTVQVSTGTGNFTVDLSAVWSDMSYGDHEIVCVAEQNGYKTGARIRFTKSASAVMVTTKPHSSAARPASCRLVGNLVVPTGAVLTQEVTNNGNDASPTWETYTGNEHFFENAEKTASQWGLAARVSIDNSHGNAVAEIKDSLAMGVLYEGGAE